MGNLIAEARAKRGLSRAALANILDVSRVAVWRWETGERLVDRKYLSKLKQELGLEPAAVRPDLAALFVEAA
jgi:transcriptional regulator with XRE-family HTH domain